MTVRSHGLWASLVGLWIAHPVPAQEPPRLDREPSQQLTPRSQPSANQQVANTIVSHLQLSGQLSHYSIDVTYQNGTAELSGVVADQSQREEALRLVQGVPGVERVLDRMTLKTNDTLTRTQATEPPLAPPLPPEEKAPLPMEEKTPPSAEKTPLAPDSHPEGATEPVPIFQPGAPSTYDLNPPKMPPNAWPTYAPYNNYSRVACPTLYPYNSWPYIGPNYPFPQVPLGWRSVKLSWQDGWWWYSKHSTGHEWWQLRFW